MCLISLHWKNHPKYKLILLANRDEFYERPATVANFWPGENNILAGKDTQAGGTWLGINKNGKLAAITNYRDLKNINPTAPSRGKLTLDYLQNDLSAREYTGQMQARGKNYNGFNLLLSDPHEMWYYSNVSDQAYSLGPGLYGLSNHLLNTPWPKVEKAKKLINDFDNLSSDQLLSGFSNRELAADEDLPDTGVGLELERKLSAMFIHFENYGTRCTILVTINYQGLVQFRERTFWQAEIKGPDAQYDFRVANTPI